MKKSSRNQASHVNSGTSIPRSELRSNPQGGPEFRLPILQVTVEPSDATALGGLSLASALSRNLGIPKLINEALHLLKIHRPFSESDHVLTHVFNLFCGGNCIEDIGDLQHSAAAKRIMETQRIPDPTTAGDFLRRFDEDALRVLDRVTDELHRRVWKKRYGKKKRELAMLDLDSHVHHVYGNQKEGADFTYKGGLGYHPLVLSLAETGECLRLLNRSGNTPSAEGAAEAVEGLVDLLKDNFKRVLIRGDSAFARQDLYDLCERHNLFFAFVSPSHPNLQDLAESIQEAKWTPFRQHEKHVNTKQRKRRGNLRRETARRRGKKDLKLEAQWLAEIPYRPSRSDKTFRLIIRRQRIETSEQGELFELWRYRYVLTNLPKTTPPAEVVNQTYQRCDQEKVIEQLQNGIAAMRMPTGTLLANAAHLRCARIAHNFKPWLAMLALPRESMRWEWKRFRKSFVFVAARVVNHARQVWVKLADSHRFAETIRIGIQKLQT